ncbi:FtsX-like permease family protein [Natrarchaeobius oligotrophus]|uniref:ABC transporter permease n=1 Tax=Natrarchaeobius chitinivorans TaxID=1679083 RepID=A0A3N6ME85_NATCH|nr:FtsX-like permease family protein [Natrarchaeobius chitinivorans]RQH02274.1 ABC transporter permease [Natrarchaeobius chitinivorans]
MSIRTRLTRIVGFLSVGVRRTVARATATDRQRVQFTVLGVAATIALLVVVTGIGVGLATGTTVYDDDVDYWIVPETDGERSLLVATDQPQFGSVHETNDRIRSYEGVDVTSPVLAEVLRIERDDRSEFVLVVGVVNAPGLESVAGVSTDALSHDDPHYANGTYDGEWTGEVVLSSGAAGLLDAERGDEIAIEGEERFAVHDVDEGSSAGGNVPVAVVQLSELQTLTGASEHDQADQFVVGTTTPAVRDDLEGVYPTSEVLTRGELTATQVADSDLSLALALTALVVAISIGTLFVLTTTGLEIVADRNQLATMSTLGITTRSQLTLTGVQTVIVTAIGGLVGSVGGLGVIRVVNEIATRTVTTEPIAVSHYLFVVYGTVVALAVGMLSLPYVMLLTRHVTGGVPE